MTVSLVLACVWHVSYVVMHMVSARHMDRRCAFSEMEVLAALVYTLNVICGFKGEMPLSKIYSGLQRNNILLDGRKILAITTWQMFHELPCTFKSMLNKNIQVHLHE